MSRYVDLPYAVHGRTNVFPRMGSSISGMFQLGLALGIVILLVGLQLSATWPAVEKARTSNLYPYAKEAQEMIAGHYMIHGRWPTSVPGMFEAVEGEGRVMAAVEGRWAPYVDAPTGTATPAGSALTHQGSFVITSNVRRFGEGPLQSLAFFLEQGPNAWPVAFRWACGHRSAAAPQGLPDPTDLTPEQRPSACAAP